MCWFVLSCLCLVLLPLACRIVFVFVMVLVWSMPKSLTYPDRQPTLFLHLLGCGSTSMHTGGKNKKKKKHTRHRGDLLALSCLVLPWLVLSSVVSCFVERSRLVSICCILSCLVLSCLVLSSGCLPCLCLIPKRAQGRDKDRLHESSLQSRDKTEQ